jgi:3-(3-hydroxy-phenyl)propionate hydroxylase
MNSGIPDAGAAALAIRHALEVPGEATGAVDAFKASRRAAALYNRDAAGLALTHMQAHDTRIRVKRRAAAWLAWAGARAGRWLDSAPYGPRSRAGDGGGTY